MASVTPEQNAAFLRTVEDLTANQLGFGPNNLTYEQRDTFNKALAANILKYPDRFSDQTLETARHVTTENYQPLSDTSFDYTQFASSAIEPAATAFVDVGKGGFATLSMLKWVLPLGGLAVIGILLYGLFVKSTR